MEKISVKRGKNEIILLVLMTEKRVELYHGERRVSLAGVKERKDFDYDTLLSIALKYV